MLKRAEIEEVLECAADDRFVLLRTRDEYAWRAVATAADWHTAAEPPDDVAPLKRSLQTPHPRRAQLVVLASVLFCVGLIAISVRPRRG